MLAFLLKQKPGPLFIRAPGSWALGMLMIPRKESSGNVQTCLKLSHINDFSFKGWN